ncbi:MAG: T9SS type A sorting domain-containing protein [Ferruginibacter sp.]
MKSKLLLIAIMVISVLSLHAQVTLINSNNSLQVVIPLSNGKTILYSEIDSSIWSTDATLPGTIQISPDIKYEEFGGLLNGTFIFRGTTATTGSEIYITDGTIPGTVLVKDIFSGATSSAPGDFSTLNAFIYFSARTAAEGRELWRTNGTLAGTTLVRDIVPGPDSSNAAGLYNLYSNGSYLLFAAYSPGSGIELWKSDGSNAGTVMLKEINTANANADSSKPSGFFAFNNMVLFVAKDATHGEEFWRTDGTTAGTILLKDINPGPGSSTSYEIFPGFSFPVFQSFHSFNNRAYFNAYDGISNGEVWGTDGTVLNTTLLKDIVQGSIYSIILLTDAINLPNKFIFPVSDGTNRSELWESDGTPANTQLFKSFTPNNPSLLPLVLTTYSLDPLNGTYTQPLFQGNKFFFTAGTQLEGYELWISDGTLPGTVMVKDINPGIGDGIDLSSNFSFLYTSTNLFFAANDGVKGNELWKSNGINAGTTMVADINLNAADALPELSYLCNNRIIFTATNGDDIAKTDLYVVDGSFISLPVKLTDFTVSLRNNDGILNWNTEQEINSKDFIVQRSYDAQQFEDIGTIQAMGTSYQKKTYAFTDADITYCGKPKVFYRLKANDKDGKSYYSNIILLKLKESSQWNIRLAENPVRDYLKILLEGTSGNVHLSIKDIAGKLVYTKSLKNTNGQISLQIQLAKGLYVLEAITNNERKMIQFVK